MQAKDVKTGAVLEYQGAPVLIKSIAVQTPSARGSATLYKFRGRNLLTKQKVDLTLKGGEGLEQADFQRRSVRWMYSDATHVHLLDQADYNQYAVNLDDVADEMKYVTEELDGMLALIYDEQCVGLQLPTAVELRITQCDPGIRGNSATGRTKPVTLETGLVVQAPEYLSEGERVKVDTRTGEFLSRA